MQITFEGRSKPLLFQGLKGAENSFFNLLFLQSLVGYFPVLTGCNISTLQCTIEKKRNVLIHSANGQRYILPNNFSVCSWYSFFEVRIKKVVYFFSSSKGANEFTLIFIFSFIQSSCAYFNAPKVYYVGRTYFYFHLVCFFFCFLFHYFPDFINDLAGVYILMQANVTTIKS